MATLAPALLGVGTGLLGSVLNLFGANSAANAAKQAAAIQAAAAARAGEGVISTTAGTNKDIISGADRASQLAGSAAAEAGKTAFGQADRANALLEPYRGTGEQANDILSKGLVAGGQFNAQPTATDIQMDPGFAARLQAGQIVRERSAAARGGAASGTALMDLEHYAQTEESNEYEKAFQRFQQNRQINFSNANTVAARGRDVAGSEGTNLTNAGMYSGDKSTNAAMYAGDKVFNAADLTANNSNRAAIANGEFITQGANAQAGGIVGSANAWNQGLSGVGNSVAAGAGIYANLTNPARLYPTAPTAFPVNLGPGYYPSGTHN